MNSVRELASDLNANATSAHLHAFSPLSALYTIARFHHIPADPATLAHQLGLTSGDTFTAEDLLQNPQGLYAHLWRMQDGGQVTEVTV